MRYIGTILFLTEVIEFEFHDLDAISYCQIADAHIRP